MPDAFSSLFSPVAPADPDLAFAATLRARLARRLGRAGLRLPLAGMRVDPLDDAQSALQADAAPTPAVVPYLIVRQRRVAIDWYRDALGAVLVGEPMLMGGRVGHAELRLGNGVVYLADEPPAGGPVRVAAPVPGQLPPVSLTWAVADVDAAVARAEAAGAEVERRPVDAPHGRSGVVLDPYGHRWLITGMTPAPTPVREGDTLAMSLRVPDPVVAQAFLTAVVGDAAEAGRPPRSVDADPTGPSVWLTFAVADLRAAVARVVAAGGSATPVGSRAVCRDDQGMPFVLGEAPGAAAGGAPRIDPGRQGDVAYITLEVGDQVRARAFLGTVLGWRFTPGRMPGGWNVEGVLPMVGLAGGVRDGGGGTAVPMYRVDDIDAAVGRVREQGGDAGAVTLAPYGRSAECVDPQGLRFHLGELS